MSSIVIKNLTFEYEGGREKIFRDASFSLDSSWKTGLIGRNGRGKTTFLNLLIGKYEYKGQIDSNLDFSYFPYEVSNPGAMALEIIQGIAPQAEDWEFIREASLLDVDAEAIYRPFNTLSNGEQTKLLLSALFLNKGKFLLIDEPKNHLDNGARHAVAKYLKSKSGFILVSHDRTLLFTMLRKLGFERYEFENHFEELSEGQKKKVMLSASLCEQANIYIWDEPLNFIDVISRSQIEDLILKFCPTLLFVEHDEYFTKRISTKEIRLS